MMKPTYGDAVALRSDRRDFPIEYTLMERKAQLEQ